MLICFLLYNLSIKSLHKISSNRSVLNLLGHARVLRIRRHVAPSDFPCPWWSSLAPPPPPLSLADRGQGPGPGPVVLKSGRNRRYRPVARPVIDSRAVTNQVSGPRPSGHFPAPTSGPRRAVPTSTVSPRPPGGRRVAEWPSRLREALSLSPPPRRRSSAVRRSTSRKPSSLERLPLRGAHSQPPSMPRCPCILGPPRRGLSRRVRTEGLRVAPLLPLFPSRGETRREVGEEE